MRLYGRRGNQKRPHHPPLQREEVGLDPGAPVLAQHPHLVGLPGPLSHYLLFYQSHPPQHGDYRQPLRGHCHPPGSDDLGNGTDKLWPQFFHRCGWVHGSPAVHRLWMGPAEDPALCRHCDSDLGFALFSPRDCGPGALLCPFNPASAPGLHGNHLHLHGYF